MLRLVSGLWSEVGTGGGGGGQKCKFRYTGGKGRLEKRGWKFWPWRAGAFFWVMFSVARFGETCKRVRP